MIFVTCQCSFCNTQEQCPHEDVLPAGWASISISGSTNHPPREYQACVACVARAGLRPAPKLGKDSLIFREEQTV